MKKLISIIYLFFGIWYFSWAQCTPTGDETSYGNGSWIGYVYDARENFNTANYVGFITENETFNTNFGNGNVITSDCSTDPNTFSIRFKMQKTFPCGEYNITIGGDDGVRLSIDGGSTWIIEEWQPQSYNTFSKSVFLNGNYDLVLEYFEAYGQEQCSFNYTLSTGTSSAGEIGFNQEFCGTSGTVDPQPFLSISDGGFCSGTVTYQWEVSNDNINFSPINGATAATYDYPSTFPQDTTLYFRRKVGNGTDSLYSNSVMVNNNSVSGNPSIYGIDEWIGYVYDGKNNFAAADFKGIMREQDRFDQNFGGSYNNISIEGCDVYAETYSVKYKMQKTFEHGIYEFTIGADDGVRLSLDGGNTYLIDDYSDHGYRTKTATDTLNGTYNMVLDFYENGGGNRVSFSYVNQMPLPVELVKFEAEREEDVVYLLWVTASEINNDYFILEKAPNSETFNVLSTKEGAGTTNVRQVYEATDNEPCDDLCYYRLKQTDFDGKTTTYPPIAVLPPESNFSLQEVELYPNPLKENKVFLKIPVAENDEIELFINDLFGKEFVSDITFINMGESSMIILEFNQNLPKGVYMISMIINKELITKKLYVE